MSSRQPIVRLDIERMRAQARARSRRQRRLVLVFAIALLSLLGGVGAALAIVSTRGGHSASPRPPATPNKPAPGVVVPPSQQHTTTAAAPTTTEAPPPPATTQAPPTTTARKAVHHHHATHHVARPATTTTTPAGGLLVAVRGKVIVIDPGHNPGDINHISESSHPVFYGEGTKPCDAIGTATVSGYSEALYNLDVAGRVAAILRAAGAHVTLTHTATQPAWGPCITERAAIGNRLHADAAVSIHADGGPVSGRGFATIVPSHTIAGVGLTQAIINRDVALATALRNEYHATTGVPLSTYLGQDGIYRSNDYGGTNLSRVPKCFIETANMRNPTDASLVVTAAFRQRAAVGIARGIALFLSRR